jgi:hypothetical protein
MKWMLTGLLVLLSSASLSARADATTDRQQLVREKALALFKASPANHCQAFADLAGFAASKAPDVGAWFEDMRLILIGADWLRRDGRRGALYIGPITTDTGFKSDLRDGSPQVEHAMAAIYVGKALPPGGADLAEHFVEAVSSGVRGNVNPQDHMLYAIGSDIGARLSKFNLQEVRTPIARTMCQ